MEKVGGRVMEKMQGAEGLGSCEQGEGCKFLRCLGDGVGKVHLPRFHQLGLF